MEQCPFAVGDIVRFSPSEDTVGLYQDVERFGVKVGEEKAIVKIKYGTYIYFEDDAGGWPWNEFTLVQKAAV